MSNLNNIPENKGQIVDINGVPTAVFNNHGKLQGFSTACPHLGCDVAWNDGENTWDCPCHGSRFEADGKLINGPAERGLDPVQYKII